MKILFLTEGGKEKGLGHITRCIALAEAAKRIYPDVKVDFAIDLDSGLGELLPAGLVADVNIFCWSEALSEVLNLARRSDMIVVDSYLARYEVYEAISNITSGHIIMIDDYNRFSYPAGIVVNPSVTTDKKKYLPKDGVIYFLGSEFIVLRKEFCSAADKNIRDNIKKVLITFGGTAQEVFTKNVEKRLMNRFGDGVAAITTGSEKIDAKGMLEFMLDADICVSSGGQTTYELARVGVPTVCVCFADNQRFNIKGLTDGGFLEYAGDISDSDILEKIDIGINVIENMKIRKARSLAGRSLVPGDGAANIFLKAAEAFEIKEHA